jgi:hypothetical protein
MLEVGRDVWVVSDGSRSSELEQEKLADFPKSCCKEIKVVV